MKKLFFVKLAAGILFIAVLVYIGYCLVSGLSGFIIDALSNSDIGSDGYENELYTREPLPTMPSYMGDDSFYDDAGSVEFGDE